MTWRRVIAVVVYTVGLVSLTLALRPMVEPVVVRLLAYVPGAGAERVEGKLSFRIEDFDSPKLGTPQGLLDSRESNISPNFEPVLNLPNESVRRPAHGVGQLRIHVKGEKEFPTCTSFLISEEYLLTAAHCLTGVESDTSFRAMQSENRPFAQIEEMKVFFPDLDSETKGFFLDVETKPAEFDPTWSKAMDYVVLKLKDGEFERARQAGYELEILTLGDVPLKAKQGFYILHYPMKDPLTLTRKFCKAVDKDPPTLENPYEFGHSCDTVPGSSGAPIFSEDHDAVVGIHVCCAYVSKERFAETCVQCNIGISLAEIAKHSPTIARLIKTKLLTRREKLLVARADILAEQSNQQYANLNYSLAAKLALAGLKPLVEPNAEAEADPAKRTAQLKDAEERLLPAAANAQGALMRAMVENRQLMVLNGNDHGWITSVAVSPDGSRIVTGSNSPFDKRGNVARVWDSRTGKLLLVLNGHQEGVNAVAFSSDGTRIVTASGDAFGRRDCVARLWDARSGTLLMIFKGHEDPVSSVAFSPNGGGRIVTGSWDGTARLWDARTGETLLTLTGHKSAVTSVAFSPDGGRIVAGSWDKTALVWDAGTGVVLHALKGHEDYVTSVAFSPDGSRIATGSGNVGDGAKDKTARVWDAGTGELLLILKGHDEGVDSVAFSPDGSRIVTGSHDATARLWDAGTGASLLALKGHEGRVSSVAFFPDGDRIATGSSDATARQWDLGNKEHLQVLRGHSQQVTSIAFSSDGGRIVTGSYDQTARVWDAANGTLLFTLEGHEGQISGVAFSPDGNRIATGSWDKTARVWDARSGSLLFTLQGHEDMVRCVAFSPDGSRIATGAGDEDGSKEYDARLWDARTGTSLLTLKGHRDQITSVAFSADGRRIVTGSYDRTARVWDALTGSPLLTLHPGGSVTSVAFSPDGGQIVTGSFGKLGQLWDSRTGALLKTLKGHQSFITSVAFSSDGSRIVTGSFDKTARVWDTHTGALLQTFRGHERRVTSVAFSPDGRRIVTGSEDKTALVWDAPRLTPFGISLLEIAGKSFEKLSANECDQFALACSPP